MIPSSRFILSKGVALGKYSELKKACDIVSYSYKTNPEVGKLLGKETGCMFSIHSIEDIKEIGEPERCLFFGQAWDEEELRLLFKLGITRFVVDNPVDLHKLLVFIEKENKKITLFLRMKLKENTVQTGKHYVYGMGTSKINELLPKLKENKNIEKLGIHFHRKTQNVSEWSLVDELSDAIDEPNWKNIDIVNIGGGLPVEYKNHTANVIQGIFDEIGELRKLLKKRNIQLMIEPGRFIAGPSVKLETNIKSIYDNNIIIDCSVYNAAMDTFVAHIRLSIEGEIDAGEAYTIKGCTPDSMDIFRYKVFLNKPKIGDKIIFLNAGAYTYSTDFCNLPKLKTEIVK